MELGSLPPVNDKYPLRFGFLYLVIGGAWIYFSDRVLVYLSLDPQTLPEFQTYKGWAFILVTGIALCLLLRRHAKQLTQFLLERDAASRDLQKSEERFKTLFEYAPDGIYLTDLQGVFVDGNKAAEKMAGYGREELIGGNFQDLNLLPPHELGRALANLQRNSMGLPTGPDEYSLQNKNGSTVPVEIRTFPVNIGGSSLSLGVARDLTQRKKSEDRILLLSRAVEQSNASVIITDLEGKIEYVNPRFSEVTGYQDAEVIGKNPRLLKSGDKAPEAYSRLWETLSAGGEWRGEFQNKKKNGELFWESASITPIRDSSGTMVHYLAVKEDITEKKLLEEELIRSQRMESVGTLASGVAHDLNNVMAPIMLAIGFLKKSMPDDRSQRMLDTIDKSSRRGTAIIKQILGFARGIEGEKGLLQLRHILNETISIIRETFPKSISIHAAIPKDLWEMRGDPTNLHQLILNLCINARDALPDGGNIRIAVENATLDGHQTTASGQGVPPGQYVHLSIADDGTGMEPEVLARIYDPFFTTKEVGRGTGLGLYTVKTIVKNHNGIIEVESTLGSGTVFRIYFPATLDSGGKTGVAEQPTRIPLGRGERILVVDDESSILQITRQTLEAHGYRVHTAADGTEAVAQFAPMMNDIDLVLTDMAMPIMDGMMTIRALRKMKPEIRIIASTGYGEDTTLEQSTETGANTVLRKPYSAELLLETVHSVLRGLS